MLLSKIKEIRNGRVIVKDNFRATDGKLNDVIIRMAREKADIPLNDDGTIRTPQQAQLAFERWYKIIKSRYKGDSRYAAEFGGKDAKTKDEITTHAYKGYTLEWDNENSKVPAKIISPKGKIIFTYSVRTEPTITGFASKVDAHLSKTKDGYQEIHMQINKLQDELEGLEGEENTPYYKSLVKQIEQLEKKLETQDSKTKDMVDSSVISDTLDDIKAGKDPNRAFAAALEDNNFYGPKSKQDRVDMANALRSKGVNVNLATVEKMLGISDSKDTYDPTKPKNIAAAKSLSVAQGKAAVGDKKVKDGVAPELVDKLMDSHIGTAKVWNRKQVEKVLQILTAQGSIGTNTPFTVIIGKVDREIGQ